MRRALRHQVHYHYRAVRPPDISLTKYTWLRFLLTSDMPGEAG